MPNVAALSLYRIVQEAFTEHRKAFARLFGQSRDCQLGERCVWRYPITVLGLAMPGARKSEVWD